MNINGVIPPMLTPVETREGGLNTESLRTLTETLVDRGVHGLFPCGTTGEFSSMTRNERRSVIETVSEASGETPVLAGCGDTGIGRVRTLARDAADAGADAAVIVTPYYLSTTQDGLCEFFERLADDLTLPVVLYDIPGLTDQRLEVESVVRLAEHDNVIGIKDSGGDLSHFYRLLRRMPEGFSVLQGSTTYAPQSIDMGADGFVSGEANVIPGVLAEVYETMAAGERERAVALMNEDVFPLIDVLSTMPIVPAIKYLARLEGHGVGPPMVPLPELTSGQKSSIEGYFD